VTRLSESDFRAVLEFLREADAVEGPDPFPVSLLESLRRLVPADNAAYDELDRDRREELALVVSDEDEPIAECAAESEERLALLWRIVPQHPLCVYQAVTGDTAAVKVSDLLSYERLRSTAIYSDWYALACVRDEIEVGISTSKRVTRNFLLQRRGDRRPFSDRDRDVLDILQPHLRALYERAADRRRATAALGAMSAMPSVGVIVFNPDDHRITLATDSAGRLVNTYLGTPLGDVLPERIGDWARAQRRRSIGDGLPELHEGLTLVGSKRLTVRLAADDTIVLEETPIDPSRGLTKREREVLALVAEGKSNTGIAAAMWITTGTVRKHLEHIYDKLDVSSRTEAVARAFSIAGGRWSPNDTADPPL
jgi:DNA-binding CsgD family transcriptional regulator